jgi:hypothetical protein
MEDIHDPVSSFIRARSELRGLGILLRITPGQFEVNYVGGLPATAEYADDLSDALIAGRTMALLNFEKLPPLGPMGRRNTRKGMMFKHNMKLASIRRRGVTSKGGK